MGIKTMLLQKKLEKAGTPLEAFLAPKIFEKIYEIVKTAHAEENKVLQQKLNNYSKDFLITLKNLGKEIESSIQKDTEKSKDDAIKTISVMLQQLDLFKSDCLTKINEHHNVILNRTNQKVEEILNNIEQFRGPEGKQGPKGNDGSPDTAEQVVAKVNKAGGVKMSAIEGLPETIKAVKKASGGKSGGGMGNIQHETKPISAATTTVNTTYPVAAGGRAAWLYYQGQFLVYGTHYTIAGKTITLTFDKVDGTFLDITYIR